MPMNRKPPGLAALGLALASALTGRATSPETSTSIGLLSARGSQGLYPAARMSSTLSEGGNSFSKKRKHMWLKT